MPFPIIEVPLDAPEIEEPIGSKTKFWYRVNDHYYLYKKARENTGEDWSEKIASELCKLLKLPHANYDLAIFNGDYGTISPSFLPPKGELILGNEILSELVLE